MEYYTATFAKPDAYIIENMVNQGIDAHLQAFTDSEFVWSDRGYGHKLECRFSAKDIGILLRRLLETENEQAECLAYDIADTLGIENLWLCTNDRFFITLYEDDELFKSGWETLAFELDLPYVSVFNESVWKRLFEKVVS